MSHDRRCATPGLAGAAVTALLFLAVSCSPAPSITPGASEASDQMLTTSTARPSASTSLAPAPPVVASAAPSASPSPTLTPPPTPTSAPTLAGPGLAGRVTAAATKTPAAGVEVVAYRGGTGCYARVASTVTDGSGRYVLALPAGRYCLGFTPPMASGLAPQWWKAATMLGTVTEIDVSGPLQGIDAALVRGFAVSGKVTSKGTPAASAAVWLQTTWGSNYNAVAFQVADASGAFRIVVPVGTYVLRISLSSQIYYWNGAATPVRVGPSATLVVDRDVSDIVIAIP